jgi:alkylation response protein AidB-like acyl-CoA dehydrogenase
MRTSDLSRRFGAVRFEDVRLPASSVVGSLGGADTDVWWALQVALVMAAAESVGAMQSAFDMTVGWAFDRYSFGRPLASYQALKHRFADMKAWLEASHAIADAAAFGVATGADEAADLASAAAAYIGERGADLAQDCVQLHGGIGVTFEHDLHVYMRRIVVNRTAYGTPADHRRRLADLAEAAERRQAGSLDDLNGGAP